jgi:hypothetical protein
MSAADSTDWIERAFGGIWRRIPLFWRFQLGGWIVFTVFSFPLKWVVLETVPGSLLISLYRDSVGFLLTLGMREIYRRVYRAQTPVIWVTVVVILVSLVGGAVLTAFSLAFHGVFDFEEEKIFHHSMVFGIFYFRTGLCAGWSLLYFGIKFFRDSMQRDLSLSRAEVARQRAELQMLRAQMNPHFLFNALTTIRAGLARPGPQLKNVVQALADYLRYSLEHRNEDLVALGDEFDAVMAYLAVEKARFREEMEMECHIEDAARTVTCPGILLQPLVENAIKYGRKTSPLPLKVRLAIACHSPRIVRVEVANTGHWIEPPKRAGLGGVGLDNLRQRLALLYPAYHKLEILTEDEWVVVRVDFPLAP